MDSSVYATVEVKLTVTLLQPWSDDATFGQVKEQAERGAIAAVQTEVGFSAKLANARISSAKVLNITLVGPDMAVESTAGVRVQVVPEGFPEIKTVLTEGEEKP